jgi:hypothetical protein
MAGSRLPLDRCSVLAGDYRPVLDHLHDATRWHFDAGDSSSLTWCLALISALLERCDLTEPAATIAGYATPVHPGRLRRVRCCRRSAPPRSRR